MLHPPALHRTCRPEFRLRLPHKIATHALATLLLCVVACPWSTANGAESASRPNIVLIVADDLGYSDLGCYGGEIATPHLDRLAERGIRLRHFYNCARCCPTRASLMTGLYAHQVGLARNGESLNRQGMTIAEGLKAAGYQTAMTGKWHLTKTPILKQRHLEWVNHQYDPGVPFGPLDTYPVSRGFDRHFGIIWGVVNYFDPFSLVDGTTPVATVPPDFYMTDAITEHAVEYIKSMSEREAPFFLYVAHCAPHWPLHARPADTAKYQGQYDAGWDALRKKRYARQLELGVIDAAAYPFVDVQGPGPAWEKLDEATRAREADCMEVHAAMVDRLDQGVGEIIAALEATNRLENTLILFLADNGASPERVGAAGYDRPSATRDGRAIRYQDDLVPGEETSFAGIGPRFASAANTPLKFWKKESFEGGCRTPCIAAWPVGIRTRLGQFADDPAHVIDVLPTCLELAGAKYPAEFAGQAILPLEGRSLSPIWRGESRAAAPLFFEHEGGRAVLDWPWKLVAKSNGAWELYDLAHDQTESRNLAAADLEPAHAERVRELSRNWEAWAKRVGAKLPQPEKSQP